MRVTCLYIYMCVCDFQYTIGLTFVKICLNTCVFIKKV
jgi:hypothetical protein